MKKSLKFLSLIGVSALLFACNNTNNEGDDPNKPIVPKEEGLVVKSDLLFFCFH